MAMSKGVATGSIVIGCGLSVLTLISLICGAVAMSKMSSPAAVSVGLWGIYFAVPSVLSIIAGYKKLNNMLGVALGTHVVGIVLAIVGLAIAAAFWSILDSDCYTPGIFVFKFEDRCICRFSDDHTIYEASCDDLKVVRNATGAITIIFAFCGIATFVGSIYGCIGTCCAPQEPAVIVTTAVPAHTNAVVVTSNTQQTQAYGIQQPQAYAMQPPPYGEPGGYAQGHVVVDQKY